MEKLEGSVLSPIPAETGELARYKQSKQAFLGASFCVPKAKGCGTYLPGLILALHSPAL